MRKSIFVLAATTALGLAVTASAAQVTFVDRAEELGVLRETFGRGAAMVDLDRDGRLDLIGANAGMRSAFFRQRVDGTFVEASETWGIEPDERSSWGVLAADFDNDGDRDVYFLNGAFNSSQRNQLLRNDLDTLGVFTDVSAVAGEADLDGPTFGGTAVDYDRDGDLDIFMANTSGEFDGMGGAYPNVRPLYEGAGLNLLRNDGGLVFTEVTSEAGLVFSGQFKHAGWGDLDNDGWPDLAAGNYLGQNVLFRNLGDGTFEEVASAAGVASPDQNFGFVFDDFDNDGWMDIYLPKYQSEPTGPSELYLNNRDGTFRDVTTGSGITGQTDMGHNVADVDADGYPDIYVGTGHPDFRAPDKLFLVTPNGSGGLTATDASVSSGILSGGNTRSHGHAFGDYDGDGDVDIYVNNGGPQGRPATRQESFLWENRGNANGWFVLDLEGVLSNRDAVGVRARAVTDSGRSVYRTVTIGKGFGNSSDTALHFGLGVDAAVETVDLDWPSGIRQTLLRPPVSQRHAVVETGIVAPASAVLGSVYTIDLYGPANEEFVVLRSDAPDERPLPEFGGMALLERPVRAVGTGTIDGSGHGSVAIQLPDDPAMAGEFVYFQAWIHEPDETEGGALSNRLDVELVEVPVETE